MGVNTSHNHAKRTTNGKTVTLPKNSSYNSHELLLVIRSGRRYCQCGKETTQRTTRETNMFAIQVKLRNGNVQQLDGTYATREAASEEATRMIDRNGWIAIVVETENKGELTKDEQKVMDTITNAQRDTGEVQVCEGTILFRCSCEGMTYDRVMNAISNLYAMGKVAMIERVETRTHAKYDEFTTTQTLYFPT